MPASRESGTLAAYHKSADMPPGMACDDLGSSLAGGSDPGSYGYPTGEHCGLGGLSRADDRDRPEPGKGKQRTGRWPSVCVAHRMGMDARGLDDSSRPQRSVDGTGLRDREPGLGMGVGVAWAGVGVERTRRDTAALGATRVVPARRAFVTPGRSSLFISRLGIAGTTSLNPVHLFVDSGVEPQRVVLPGPALQRSRDMTVRWWHHRSLLRRCLSFVHSGEWLQEGAV